RSSRAVMRYSQIIESSSQMIPQLAIEGEAGCYDFENESDEASWIADKIVHLKTYGSKLANMNTVPTDECAVLARNRYVLASLRDELGKRGIGYNERIASGGAASSESDLFNYFHTGLRLMTNPSDTLHLNRLNTEFSREEKFASFEEILTDDGTYDGLSLAASEALRAAWNCLVRSSALRFDLALDVLRNLCSTKEAFSGDDDRLLAVSDCEQWTKWWEKYCLSTGPSSRSLNGFLRALSLGEVLDSQQDGEGLTLSTIHLAKGLEFDVVFIIGLNEGTFPDYRSRTPAQLDEERHSMFVAITRAKRICYVTRPKLRKMPWGDLRVQVPSRFFTELQSESR
ncbi:MAG: ATP-dependent helicase, partial [Coriobacteriales bacterium]|nr:ATP-dependent helicase [Coriobacteriales bacterium]